MGIFDNCLLLSDLDGTFLDENGEMHKKNVEAARFFMAEGGRFSLATGRPVRTARRFVEELRPNAPCLFCNGGIIYDFAKDETILVESLKGDPKAALEDMVKKHPQLGLQIFTADKEFCTKRPEGVPRFDDYLKKFEISFNDIENVALPWVKAILIGSNENLLKIEQELKKEYPLYTFIRTSDVFLEIVPRGTSKGNSLLYLAEHLGISLDNSFAIGDFDNDITMVEIAEQGAITSNAPPHVKTHADIIVSHHSEGSVAEFISHLVEFQKKRPTK